MKRHPFLIGALLVLLSLGWSSCGSKQQDYSLRLTARERTRIDTIYSERLDSLRPIWDSLCDERWQSMVDRAVDSIIEERLEEEARLRARLPAPQ